ncbi:hypothetical protein SDC9_187308 [bioreactor metagenome]|uniref:Uncharacterized protein n=1 Tax=bioreactor metagenome TaxID=1076179 RepID=A0A645HLA4_9ZZZZ
MTNLRGACYARDLIVDIAANYRATVLLKESCGNPVTIRAFWNEKGPGFRRGNSETHRELQLPVEYST